MLFLLMLLPYIVSACTGSTCLYMPFLQGLSFANCKEAISRSTSHECKQILLASVEWWHFGKKTKKAWASTIMSNVTRRQGHRTLVAKQKKQTIYRKRQGWNSRNSKPSFLQLTRQPEPDDPQFILGNDGLVSFYADVIVSKLHFVVTSTACQIYERYYIERIYMWW